MFTRILPPASRQAGWGWMTGYENWLYNLFGNDDENREMMHYNQYICN
jgi:hypothetical protein